MAAKGGPVVLPSELEIELGKLKKASTPALHKKLENKGYTTEEIKGWTREHMIDILLMFKGLKPSEPPKRTAVRSHVSDPSVTTRHTRTGLAMFLTVCSPRYS